MIAMATVGEIKRLLEEGQLSQREIARRLGVSRGTVNGIALGRRADPSQRPRNPEIEFLTPDGPLTRCPGCGGLVLMPCLACRLRAMKETQRLRDAANPTRPPRVRSGRELARAG